MTQKIKRGVSLYSFQNETYLGKMSLDQAIGHCAAFGARGIEVVGEPDLRRLARMRYAGGGDRRLASPDAAP